MRNRGSVSAISAGAYTTTLFVMVDLVKGGGRAPPPAPAWANFSIMMECTPEFDVATLCVLYGVDSILSFLHILSNTPSLSSIPFKALSAVEHPRAIY